MGVTQTTVALRLEPPHAGARLLQKTPASFASTPAGERMLASVQRMEEEATRWRAPSPGRTNA